MPKSHKVEPGDCIASIALEHGFFPDTLWKHADNADLKKKRGDPYSLEPGDIVKIPDKKIKDVPAAPEKTHKFKRKAVPEKLRIRFMVDEEPRKNIKYRLDVDGLLTEGQSDGEGWVEVPIPPDARQAKIFFAGDKDPIELDLGYLGPIEEVSGVQGRLANLGYYHGLIDGKMTPELEAALVDFQMAKNLKLTGQIDDDTKKALKDAYGA